MAPGPIGSPKHDAELLLHVLGKNRICVNHYIAQASHIASIAGGGSDRQFFRLELSRCHVVLMVSPPEDEEFQNYLSIARFLRSIKVAAPEIYDAYPDEHILVMEDLGDTSLHAALADERSQETIIAWYRQALNLLARMQVEGRNHWQCCPAVRQRTFDYASLRWETDYFRTFFVEKYCAIDLSAAAGLSEEFKRLAHTVASEPLFFMHRDFQSQNLMVYQDTIRVIDFQGARKGLLQYDLASLLKDCYLILPARIQQKLIASYIESLIGEDLVLTDPDRFFDLYTLAGLQRNMQALGAFAFLSREKGKTWFEQHIPAGLHHLKTALADRKDFPVLGGLVNRIAEQLSLS